MRRDRIFKKWLYANAGIAVYWIVNLAQNRVEVHTGPSGAGEQADYLEQRGYVQDEEIPLLIEGREVGRIRVRDLLP